MEAGDEKPTGGLFDLGKALLAERQDPPENPRKLRADIYRAHAEGDIGTAELITHIAKLAPVLEAESRRRLVAALMGIAPEPASEPAWVDWPVGRAFIANDSTEIGPATLAAYHDGNGTVN